MSWFAIASFLVFFAVSAVGLLAFLRLERRRALEEAEEVLREDDRSRWP